MNEKQLKASNELWQQIRSKAAEVGEILLERYPVTEVDSIPAEGAEVIADVLTMFIAEVVQCYINAGSEREVTLEELGPVIEEHIKSWVL